MKIDVTDFEDPAKCKALANMQINHTSRVQVVNGNIVKVFMKPEDNEAVKPGNIKNRKDAGRQRNEIRFKDPAMCLGSNKSGEWRLNVRLDTHPGFSVDGPGFYHVVQIKCPEVSRPVFTLGIKKDYLVVYCCDGVEPSHVRLVLLNTIINKWMSLRIKIDRVKKTVTYDIDGHNGTFSTAALPDKEMYLKIGQYRSFPNDAKKIVSSSYKMIEIR
jgi:hypothetical protein